jgi:polysaccharide biosynthesis protein PslH
MRILWLNVGLLLPLDKGGRLRTWHLMRHLARRHEITYLAFRDTDQPESDLVGMYEVCSRLETMRRRESPKRSLKFYAEAARYLAHPQPYAVAKYRSLEYARRLQALLDTSTFDLIVCDFLPPLVNLPARLPCPAVLFTHNVEAEIWRRHAETATGPAAPVLLRTQWRRMQRFERAALNRFNLVLAVSEADRKTFERLYAPSVPIAVVPTGVDTSYFTPAAPLPADARNLVFTGSMDWLPNEDGMTYFCREILPRIRRVEPDTTLSIVGRAPTSAVRQLAAMPGVSVTGRVEDVRPYIARGAVYVVPLRIGGGTRLKIFEAMAMGRAIVSTTVGAEGLPVTPGEHLIIADNPDRFALAVIRLLRDASQRTGLEQAARRLVVERFDWAAAAAALDSALETAAGNQPLKATA